MYKFASNDFGETLAKLPDSGSIKFIGTKNKDEVPVEYLKRLYYMPLYSNVKLEDSAKVWLNDSLYLTGAEVKRMIPPAWVEAIVKGGNYNVTNSSYSNPARSMAEISPNDSRFSKNVGYQGFSPQYTGYKPPPCKAHGGGTATCSTGTCSRKKQSFYFSGMDKIAQNSALTPLQKMEVLMAYQPNIKAKIAELYNQYLKSQGKQPLGQSGTSSISNVGNKQQYSPDAVGTYVDDRGHIISEDKANNSTVDNGVLSPVEPLGVSPGGKIYFHPMDTGNNPNIMRGGGYVVSSSLQAHVGSFEQDAGK